MISRLESKSEREACCCCCFKVQPTTDQRGTLRNDQPKASSIQRGGASLQSCHYKRITLDAKLMTQSELSRLHFILGKRAVRERERESSTGLVLAPDSAKSIKSPESSRASLFSSNPGAGLREEEARLLVARKRRKSGPVGASCQAEQTFVKRIIGRLCCSTSGRLLEATFQLPGSAWPTSR